MDEDRIIQNLEKLLGQQNKDINRLIAEFRTKVRAGQLSSGQTQQAIKAFTDLAKNSKNLNDEQKKQISDLQKFTKSIETSTKVIGDFNSTLGRIKGSLFGLGDATVTGAEKIGYYTNALQDVPLVGKAIDALGQSLDFNIDNFRSLASVGADFGQSLIQLRVVARDALLPLREFTDFIGSETNTLAGLFGSVNQGTAAVSQLARGVRENLIPQFAGLGITTENYLDFLGTFLELQRTQGRREFQSQEQTTAALSNYTLVLDAVTKLTGVQRDQLNDAIRRQGSDAKFQIFLQGLETDRALRLQTFIAGLDSLNPALGDAVKNIVSTGFPLGEFESNLVATSGNLMSNIQALRAGTIDIGAFAQGLAGSADAFTNKFNPAVLATNTSIGEVGNALISFRRNFTSLDEITRQQLAAGDGLTSQIGVTQESFRQFKSQIEGLQTSFLQSFGPNFASFLGLTTDGMKGLTTAVQQMAIESPKATGAAVASAQALKYGVNYAKEVGIIAAGTKLGTLPLTGRLGQLAGSIGRGAGRLGVGGIGLGLGIGAGELAEQSESFGGRALGVAGATASGALLGSVIPGVGTTIGAIAGGLYGLAKAIDLPERATGGPLSANQLALVGERGPELFLPSTSGMVEPLPSAGYASATASAADTARETKFEQMFGQQNLAFKQFADISARMEKHLNTLVGISAKTEKNTENSTRRLANLSGSLV